MSMQGADDRWSETGPERAGLTRDESDQDQTDATTWDSMLGSDDDESVTLQADDGSTWDSMLDGEDEESEDETEDAEPEDIADDTADTTAEDAEDVDPSLEDLNLDDLNLDDLSEMDPEQLQDLMVEVEDMIDELGGEGVDETISVDSSAEDEAPTEEAPADPPPETTYEVQEGDTLWDIAEEHLGDGARWPEIADLNSEVIEDPDLIQVGWQLRIPSDSPEPAAEDAPADSGQETTDGSADSGSDAGIQVENANYAEGSEDEGDGYDTESVVLVEDDGTWGDGDTTSETSGDVEQVSIDGDPADTTTDDAGATEEESDLVIADVGDGPGHSGDAPGQGEDDPGLGEGPPVDDLTPDLDADAGLDVEGDLALHDVGVDAGVSLDLNTLRSPADFDVDDGWWS